MAAEGVEMRVTMKVMMRVKMRVKKTDTEQIG